MQGSRAAVAAALTVALAWAALPAAAADWAPFADAGTVRIVTQDEDGAERDTPVWLVVVDESAYVRTDDSRWLANIRRGSGVALRLDEATRAVSAEEVDDPAVRARVEEAYKAKYGFVQRMMSFFRMREPSVLRLTEKAP
jgi:hypothetical protein